MDFALGLLTDAAMIGGVITVAMAFRKKHALRRSRMVLAGLALVAIGALFTNWAELREASREGSQQGNESVVGDR